MLTLMAKSIQGTVQFTNNVIVFSQLVLFGVISYPSPSDRAALNIYKTVISVVLHSTVTHDPLKCGKSKYDRCVKIESLRIIWVMRCLHNAALHNLWLTRDCCSKAQSCLYAHYEGRQGSGNIASVILNLGTRRWWVNNFTPRQMYSRRKTPLYHWREEWVDSRAGLDALEEWEITCFCRNFNHNSSAFHSLT